MWADPQHGRVFADREVRELLQRVTDRVGAIVAGPTLDAVAREIAAELVALNPHALEPAVVIPAGHEAGPGMMDLWARVVKLTDDDDALPGRILNHVDRAVEWQARQAMAA